MAQLIDEQCDTLLDRSYALFKAELERADPDYAARIGLADLTLDTFATRYFAERMAADPFAWARANLAEAQANYETNIVVPWRYAILRMHEVLALITPHLGEAALERFNRFLKPVFVDEYATVPHVSIERLLALHRANCLQVLALGEEHRIATADPGAIVVCDGQRRHFPVFVDATGQRPLTIDAFPFPGLIDQGIVCDAAESDDGGPRGIMVDETFQPVSDDPAAQRLFCLGIPFLLDRHPFIQGITSSHEMGLVVGAALARGIARSCTATVTP